MRPEPVACQMLHSVGLPNPAWVWRHLTVPVKLFEGQLRLLRRLGYRSVGLDEYRELACRGLLNKERVICLTFDDGYLDNWVYAAPLLSRYGFKGTVFVSLDFIDPGLKPRPQWNPNKPEIRPRADGFLNLGELRALEAGGVLDVQSHAVTHTWYPRGTRIVDFRRPGDTYHWMTWNKKPQDKWRQLQPEAGPEEWGEPVYEHGKSLDGPRLFPDERVAEGLRACAAEAGRNFFQQPDWRERLGRRAEDLQRQYPAGHLESETEFLARAEKELADSAAGVGDMLGKTVHWLCWPGGGYSPALFDLAARHYTGTTIASRDSATPGHVDTNGCFRFRRFGPLHQGEGDAFRYLGPLTNALYVEERRAGNPLVRLTRGGLTRLARLR